MNRRLEKECESATEYLLPDYMGDVKKLLMSRARIVPAGKFVSDGSVEVSGNVEYDLLYLDSSGKLTAVNAASDYLQSFEVDGESYTDSAEESRVGALKVRVTGPRKISLKAEVKTVLAVSADTEISVEGNAFSDEGREVEKCTAEISFASSLFEKSAGHEYAEVLLSFEGTAEDGVEIASVNAVSKITEAKAGDGDVTLKGENIVSCIMFLPEGAPRAVKKAFAFEERIAVEGAREGMCVISSSDVCSATVDLSADGDYMSLIANLNVQYGVELIENKALEVVTDAYTPGCECKNKYSDVEFSELIKAGCERFQLSLRCDKAAEKLESVSDVISVGAELRTVAFEAGDGFVRFFGDVMASGIGYETNVDGSITYLPFKIQSQFDEKVNIDCQNKGKTQLDAQLYVEDCEVSDEGESLLIRCFLCAKYYLFSNKSARVITLCETEENRELLSEKSTVTVYYPQSGERLFDIAKKYKTTSLKIAKDNELSDSALASFDSPDSLIGVKRLIIR